MDDLVRKLKEASLMVRIDAHDCSCETYKARQVFEKALHRTETDQHGEKALEARSEG